MTQRRPTRRTSKSQKSPAKAVRPPKLRKRARPTKPPVQRYNPRLETGVKAMRKGDSLAAAARKIGESPRRLRRYLTAIGIVTRRDGKWVFKRDRRFRRMPLYSAGQRVIVMVRGRKTPRLIGQYMSAVGEFFSTEDLDLLAPFRGQSIIDINGKRYVFETRPNVLFRLDASGVEPFELVYAIVKPT